MDSTELREKKVLIIDDDTDLCFMLGTILSREGADVFASHNGQDGLRRLFEHRPDLIFLDIMLPGLNGWEVCRQVRFLSDVPIIILSALSQEKEIVRGLDAGADDYITKPFSRPVLLARSQAALRRAALPPVSQKLTGYEDHYLAVSLETHQVSIQGQLVKLTTTEYRLLAYLVKHIDQIRTFSQILKHVWGEAYQDSAEYVHSYVWNLRQKIEPTPKKPIYIITEHTIGYRFVSYSATSQ